MINQNIKEISVKTIKRISIAILIGMLFVVPNQPVLASKGKVNINQRKKNL